MFHATEPSWTHHRTQSFRRLKGATRCDVLVIGGGITGLSVAAECQRRGHDVVVAEAREIGQGTTAASSGHLDAVPEHGARHLIDAIGLERAKEFTTDRLRAIDQIRDWADSATHFQTKPIYQYAETEASLSNLRDECTAMRQLGLDVSWQEVVAFPGAIGGVRIDGGATINTAAYLAALTRRVESLGATIYEKTPIEAPAEANCRLLKTPEGSISAKHVVCAAHCNFTAAMLEHTQLPPMQSYLLVAEVADRIADAMFWDDADPYHYVRQISSADAMVLRNRHGDPATPADGHFLLIGGEDHRTGMGDSVEAVEALKRWASERFEVVGFGPHWSAELFEPIDGLPMVGRVTGYDNVYQATGLSGIGLTVGTAAASWLADCVEYRTRPLLDAIGFGRFGVGGLMNYAKASLEATVNVTSHLLPRHELDADQLGSGEGTIAKVDGQTVAICRDHDGCVHTVRGVCPHMGGALRWNELEQTWDCPLHGGRFAADGTRLYGPAEDDLEVIPTDSSDSSQAKSA